MKSKIRLDQYLVDKGLCPTRSQALAMIMAGQVFLDDQPVYKAGTAIEPGKASVRIQDKLPYVSRGGLKLAKALETFEVSVNGHHCLDVGASTGGFTDCLLQAGATHVYAVDVGYGQLDWKLRQDPRVSVFEKTNIRHLTPAVLQAQQLPSLAVVDVSFIGLSKVLPSILGLLAVEGAQIIALVKPQFEYKDQPVNVPGFQGVIHDQEAHEAILNGVLTDIQAQQPLLSLQHLDFSPIRGPEGNIEFLAHWQQTEHPGITDIQPAVHAIVLAAHGAFQTP